MGIAMASAVMKIMLGGRMDIDIVIISCIMPLVPGIAFTTSIRDIYNGDYLSGTIHLLDALITAVCVAVGACLPFVVMKYIGGL